MIGKNAHGEFTVNYPKETNIRNFYIALFRHYYHPPEPE
jgi:hypothetical protein